MSAREQHIPRRNRLRRGNSLIEFVLLGIPIIFLTISIVDVSLDMWQYHSLAYSTDTTARYATLHGATCATGSNSCTITIGKLASFYANQALALDASQVNVSFTDGTGTIPCNPVNTCTISTTQFPRATSNSVGMDVKVVATCTLRAPLGMYWPPNSTPSGPFTVSATSRQRIVF